LWRNGSFAEKALFPAECLTPLGLANDLNPVRLACLNFLTIAYGGLLAGAFRAGETLIINGATGNLGASGVLIALALGASRIFAIGRDVPTLEQLHALNPARVIPLALTGDTASHRAQIIDRASGADMTFDVLGRVETAEQTLGAVEALHTGGRAVWMGGVRAAIPLPYNLIMRRQLAIHGAFMYPRHVAGDLLRMAATGALDLSRCEVVAFPLTEINSAVTRAATFKGLQYCVIVP
jgi:alcohol dehydrogenase